MRPNDGGIKPFRGMKAVARMVELGRHFSRSAPASWRLVTLHDGHQKV